MNLKTLDSTQIDRKEIKQAIIRSKEKPLNSKEASKLLKISISTLKSYVANRKIPFYRRFNRLFFFESELLMWILGDDPIKTDQELEAEADHYVAFQSK